MSNFRSTPGVYAALSCAHRGADAVGFLNGFSTQEFSRLGQEGAIFSAFLNSKGRTVFDAVALAAGRDGAFDTTSIFLDVAAESAEQALQHLRRYRLRADVKLADVSHKFAAVTLLGRGQGSSVTDEAQSMAQAVACIAADTSEAKFARQTCAMPDPRSDVMGLKAIVPVAALGESVAVYPALCCSDRTLLPAWPESPLPPCMYRSLAGLWRPWAAGVWR